LRSQTGQRDQIEKGIQRSSIYIHYLRDLAKNFNLPPELLAIPFLESSFNPKAESKVGASGIWQIMPYISGKLLSRDKSKNAPDLRNNPIIASLAAFHYGI
jgi:membrane-bound lytic murein transglycosylase D